MTEIKHPKVAINISTFGHKWGIPGDLDYKLDCRTIKNPGTARSRKKHTGMNKDIIKDVMKSPKANMLISEGISAVKIFVESFEHNWDPSDEQVSDVVYHLGVGCMGGKHRSVCVAQQIYEVLAMEFKDSEWVKIIELNHLHIHK